MEIREDNLVQEPTTAELGETIVNMLAANPQKQKWFLEILTEEIIENNSTGLTLREKRLSFKKKVSGKLDSLGYFYGVIGFYVKVVFLKIKKNRPNLTLLESCELLTVKLLEKESLEKMRIAVKKIFEDVTSESTLVGRAVKENIDQIALESGQKLLAVVDARPKTFQLQKYVPLSLIDTIDVEKEPFKEFSLLPYLVFLNGKSTGRGALPAVLELLHPSSPFQNVFDAKLDLKAKTDFLKNYGEILQVISGIDQLELFKGKNNIKFGESCLFLQAGQNNLEGESLIKMINFFLLIIENEKLLASFSWTDDWEKNMKILDQFSKQLNLPGLKDILIDFSYLTVPNSDYYFNKNDAFSIFPSTVNPILESVIEMLGSHNDTRSIAYLMFEKKPDKIFFHSSHNVTKPQRRKAYFLVESSSGVDIKVSFELENYRLVSSLTIDILQPYEKDFNVSTIQAELINSESEAGDSQILTLGNGRLELLVRKLRNKLANSQNLLAKILPNVDFDLLISSSAAGFWLMGKEFVAVQTMKDQVRAIFAKLFWTKETDILNAEVQLSSHSVYLLRAFIEGNSEEVGYNMWSNLRDALGIFSARVQAVPEKYQLSSENKLDDITCQYLMGSMRGLVDRIENLVDVTSEVKIFSADRELIEEIEAKSKKRLYFPIEDLLDKSDSSIENAGLFIESLSILEDERKKSWLKGKDKREEVAIKMRKLIDFLKKSRYSNNKHILTANDFEILILLKKLEKILRLNFSAELKIDKSDIDDLSAIDIYFIVENIGPDISKDKLSNLFFYFWKEFAEASNHKYFDLSSGFMLEVFSLYLKTWHDLVLKSISDKDLQLMYSEMLKESILVLFEIGAKNDLLEKNLTLMVELIQRADKAGIEVASIINKLSGLEPDLIVGLARNYKLPSEQILNLLCKSFLNYHDQQSAKYWALFSKEDLLLAMQSCADDMKWEETFEDTFEEIHSDLELSIKKYLAKEKKADENYFDEIKQVGWFLSVINNFELKYRQCKSFQKLSCLFENFLENNKSITSNFSKTLETVPSILADRADKALSKVPKYRKLYVWTRPLEGRLAQAMVERKEPEVVEVKPDLFKKNIVEFVGFCNSAKILNKIKKGQALSKLDSEEMGKSTVSQLVKNELVKTGGLLMLLGWVKKMKEAETLWSDEHVFLIGKIIVDCLEQYYNLELSVDLALILKEANSKVKKVKLENAKILIQLLVELDFLDEKLIDEKGEVLFNKTEKANNMKLFNVLRLLSKDIGEYIRKLPILVARILEIKSY